MKQSNHSSFSLKHFFKSILLVLFIAASLGAVNLKSPDSNIQITIDAKDSKDGQKNGLFWSVSYQGKSIIANSRLGLKLKDDPNPEQGFTIVETSRTTQNTTWKPVYGERSEIRDHYNQLIINLQDDQNPPRKLQLKIRAYNEGAAFCYTIPQQNAWREIVIESENTQFRFNDNHAAWAVYSAQGRYEKTTLDKIRPNCERPLTVKIADNLYVAVAEARLVDYARMRLKPAKDKKHTLVSMLAGEVKATAPYTTPWRVIMIGDSPGQLLERNYLLLNLNEPCAIEDASWIKPGKVIREVTLTTAGGKACVDFAVERGLQYIEFDAGWYGHENDVKADASTIDVDPRRSQGPLDLHEVIRYAKERGIGVWVYVNRRHLERQLDTILPLYKKWGIKGVKYGFVQVGSQKWTAWLHEAIRKAAKNQLMVDVHDEYRPTGFERTYPNFLTAEGIGGNETMPPAEQNLTYPFTRYLCGPADYTICWYSSRVKNTRAHQLAAAVVCYSPLQFIFWYDRPQMYQGEPEVKFFKHVPTTWDESRVLQGAIGEYITLARRKGNDWFVASMNAVQRRKLKIPFSFLKPGQKYLAHIYNDSSPQGNNRTGVSIRHIEVDSTSIIIADMASNGGQAIRIVPVRTENETTTKTKKKSCYLFSYFKGNGEDGLHLAYSHDGYKWKSLNNDKSFLAPKVGGKLMRDPCILQDPDGTFHLVFTTSWNDRGIGYAYSRDLIHWSRQKFIPVMKHEPKARNCWAPELFYDDATRQFLIFWATTIPGRFGETDNQGGGKNNHRVYYVTTRDFVTFSETKLFYDQGFNVIDATLAKSNDQYVMFLKDETNVPFTPQKNIRLAFSEKAAGPYGKPSEPITGDYWCEGPSVIKIDGAWIVYFDKYRKHRYGAVASTDLKHWRDISDKIEFPKGTRHGTVFRVSESILQNLLNPPDFMIDANFPGGNVIVEKILGDTVYIRPDVRDTHGWWFYWNFRVRSAAGKNLTFQFVDRNPIGVRGPAFSADGGQTWSWLGKKSVQNNSFSYTFPNTDGDVRFCFAVPYTESNLQQFLKPSKDDSHLLVNDLCQTRKGRSTQRLHVGKLDGEPKYRVLMTCRHHACEMMASYVLEGALEVMLSNSDTGRWFQNNVEVLAVPFMDKDGVEDGDQGKNRLPHDHNRDYMGQSIYPSVRALRELVPQWSNGKLKVAIDLHCPYISGPNNEVIYQVGNRDPQLWREQTKLAKILEFLQTGTLVYKASDNLPFGKGWNNGSYYDKYKNFRLWAQKLKGMKLATTVEFPYANASGKEVTAANARAFGRDLAHALQIYLQQLD